MARNQILATIASRHIIIVTVIRIRTCGIFLCLVCKLCNSYVWYVGNEIGNDMCGVCGCMWHLSCVILAISGRTPDVCTPVHPWPHHHFPNIILRPSLVNPPCVDPSWHIQISQAASYSYIPIASVTSIPFISFIRSLIPIKRWVSESPRKIPRKIPPGHQASVCSPEGSARWSVQQKRWKAAPESWGAGTVVSSPK